jgi:hypothetical protein
MAGAKIGVTFWAETMVTLHVLVPEQLPRHPPKKYFLCGLAVNLT